MHIPLIISEEKQCPVQVVDLNYGVPRAQKVAKGYSTLRHLKRATILLLLWVEC